VPKTHEQNEPLALRVKTFCQCLGISKSTFWKHHRAGKIRVIRVGSRVLVPADEVRRVATEGVR
jgi:excisionase family DNA binding protein